MTNHNAITDSNQVSHLSLENRQEDALLVAQIKEGNQKAFTALTKKYYEGAQRVAFGVLKDRTAAEDAVQEALTKVFLKIESLEKPASFRSWMYKIVFNVAIDAYRSNRSRRDISISDEATRESLNHDVNVWVGYKQSNPANIYERKQLTETLEDSYASLSRKHREILNLREIEGLSYDEISTVLSISRGTVMSRLFHARKVMQTKLVRKFKQNSAVEYLDTLVQSNQFSVAC